MKVAADQKSRRVPAVAYVNSRYGFEGDGSKAPLTDATQAAGWGWDLQKPLLC